MECTESRKDNTKDNKTDVKATEMAVANTSNKSLTLESIKD